MHRVLNTPSLTESALSIDIECKTTAIDYTGQFAFTCSVAFQTNERKAAEIAISDASTQTVQAKL